MKSVKMFFIAGMTLLVNACSSSLPFSQPQVVIDPTTVELINDLNFATDYSPNSYCAIATDEPIQAEPPWVEPDTIWPRITTGYQLGEHQHPRIDSEFNWYQRNPSYMSRVSKRAERYMHYVVEQIEARNMPMELALLPVVESAFDPFAYSHGRAAGMWQFIPGTGRAYKLDQNWWYDGRRDVVASTEAALNYLEYLHNLFDGDWMHALAAYNSGQGTVGRAIRKNKAQGKPTDFWSLNLPKETRSYVPKLLALAKLVDNPLRYGVSLYPIENAPYFAAVDTGSQLDLAEAAKLAQIDIEELYLLNPGFSRWATAPKGPHRLLVPIEQADHFSQALAELPEKQRLSWQRYQVKPGDSLLKLAKQFNTGVNTIKQVNDLHGNVIRAGQMLMIPVAAASETHYSLSATQRREAIQQRRGRGDNRAQQYYVVKDGDSFWTIARKHHVTVSKLAYWNGMSPKDTLRPGQKLSIWKTQKSVSAGRSVTRKLGYTVRSGDSLALIASKFNVSVNDIVGWNNVDPNRYLQPGQKLRLYVDVMKTGG